MWSAGEQDLSLNEKREMIYQLSSYLHRHCGMQTEAIIQARVPIVKIRDPTTGVLLPPLALGRPGYSLQWHFRFCVETSLLSSFPSMCSTLHTRILEGPIQTRLLLQVGICVLDFCEVSHVPRRNTCRCEVETPYPCSNICFRRLREGIMAPSPLQLLCKTRPWTRP